MTHIENLGKSYRMAENTVNARQHCNLHIKAGEQVAVMGRSGSGKSTLLYLLGGLDSLTEGNVIINGKNISRMNATQRAPFRRKHIGFVFQSYHLIPEMTAQENLLLPALLNGIQPTQTELDALTHQLALRDRLSHYPAELSGGQRQRVAIGRAVIHRPPVLLCGEPTGNPDTQTGKEVLHLLKTLSEQYGITLRIVTHDPAVAQQTHSIIHIADGSVEVWYGKSDGKRAVRKARAAIDTAALQTVSGDCCCGGNVYIDAVCGAVIARCGCAYAADHAAGYLRAFLGRGFRGGFCTCHT